MKKDRSKTGLDAEFIGLDLGHGETALARSFSRSHAEPEILEYRGVRSIITAVAHSAKPKTIRIGADALTISTLQSGGSGAPETEIWTKFKSSEFHKLDVKRPTELFVKTLINHLTDDGAMRGPRQSRFIVGCPSGWSADVRTDYKSLLTSTGLSDVTIVSESRAALMTALEQGYLSIDDARASVLIVDIGSSTTDFTYCRNLETDDVGHNILGSGLLDSEIFALNLARQPQKEKIEALLKDVPAYRQIMEFWCREAKEAYFTGEDKPVEMIRRVPGPDGTSILFEIRIDSEDAKKLLNRKLDALNGFSWSSAFDYALRETIDALGGRDPDAVLLTGGASRLPLVLPATQKAFPKARIIRGAEPEFAIARGLAWLGRFEFLHSRFKTEVETITEPGGEIATLARDAAQSLGQTLSPVLVDGLAEECIKPAFRKWRRGETRTLEGVEADLTETIADWLRSSAAQKRLRPVINRWFSQLQRDIEALTDPLCREHGLPAMVLSLNDSQHVSQHLEGLSLSAPEIGHLESDTALIGTTLAAVLISSLLAHANLFAPLFLNPIGIVVGGAVMGGSFLYGKKALAGRFRKTNVPVMARKVLTDGRLDQTIAKQRPELIQAVKSAWDKDAAKRFSDDLTAMLGRALVERADERAVLFLI